MYPMYFTGGMYYGANPCYVGAGAACAGGTCGSAAVAAGACGGAGGCSNGAGVSIMRDLNIKRTNTDCLFRVAVQADAPTVPVVAVQAAVQEEAVVDVVVVVVEEEAAAAAAAEAVVAEEVAHDSIERFIYEYTTKSLI